MNVILQFSKEETLAIFSALTEWKKTRCKDADISLADRIIDKIHKTVTESFSEQRCPSERCANCKFCKPCKTLINKEWKWFKICTALADEEDGWCLVIADDDLCECFTPKEQK